MRDKSSGKCAGSPADNDALDMQACDKSSEGQKFKFVQVKQFWLNKVTKSSFSKKFKLLTGS